MKTWGEDIWEDKIRSQSATAVIGGYVASTSQVEREPDMFVRKFKNLFFDRLPVGGRILDLGVGPLARFSVAFAKLGFEPWGVDVSETTLQHARTACEQKGTRMNFIKGDFLTFEAPQNFDGAFCYASFYHVPAHLSLLALQNFTRHLKPGGLLLVDFHVVERITVGGLLKTLMYMLPYYLLKGVFRRFGLKDFYVTVAHHSTAEITDMANRSGLEIIGREGNVFVFRKVG